MRQIVVFFFFFLLISCAAHQRIPNRDDNKAEPIQGGERVHIGIVDKNATVLGFNFVSPNETDWKIIRSGLSVTLTKKGDTPEENQEIEAYIIRLDTPFQPVAQYIEQVKNNLEEGYRDDQDFRIQTLNIEEYPENNQCVKIHLLLEDLLTSRSNDTTRWSEQYALSCASSVFYGMGYELRYYQQNKDDHFASKVDALFKSVKMDE